jgi:hypothetical protein
MMFCRLTEREALFILETFRHCEKGQLTLCGVLHAHLLQNTTWLGKTRHGCEVGLLVSWFVEGYKHGVHLMWAILFNGGTVQKYSVGEGRVFSILGLYFLCHLSTLPEFFCTYAEKPPRMIEPVTLAHINCCLNPSLYGIQLTHPPPHHHSNTHCMWAGGTVFSLSLERFLQPTLCRSSA